ncbi:hypothetical protein Tcan_08245 [Toxocara canis]|uniref:Uncharacterized protein n=1 Tax=Toxocara canis TaxID=6265 RepID=A0A0B2UZM0_TOXCA|nr:hypothetical protein Tcan_08245 [Toxocara canis]
MPAKRMLGGDEKLEDFAKELTRKRALIEHISFFHFEHFNNTRTVIQKIEQRREMRAKRMAQHKLCKLIYQIKLHKLCKLIYQIKQHKLCKLIYQINRFHSSIRILSLSVPIIEAGILAA